MKFVRKITSIDGRWGSCSLPKPILDELLKNDFSKLEFEYDEVRKVLHAFPR